MTCRILRLALNELYLYGFLPDPEKRSENGSKSFLSLLDSMTLGIMCLVLSGHDGIVCLALNGRVDMVCLALNESYDMALRLVCL